MHSVVSETTSILGQRLRNVRLLSSSASAYSLLIGAMAENPMSKGPAPLGGPHGSAEPLTVCISS